MVNAPLLSVAVPRFDEARYLDISSKAKSAIKSGEAASALDHYLRIGIDENKYSLIRRESVALACAVERFLVSESGFCLLLGWLADEGCDAPRVKLIGGEFNIE